MADISGKKEVRLYYIRKMCGWTICISGAALAVLPVMAPVNFHSTTLDKIFISGVGILASVFAAVSLMYLHTFGLPFLESDNEKANREAANRVRTWTKIMQLGANTFPISQDEKVAVRDTCGEVLLRFALKADYVIAGRVHAQYTLDESRVMEATHPKDLPSARANKKDAEELLTAAEENADKKYKEYLLAWNFFLHCHPEGIAIWYACEDPWARGPNEFMKLASVRWDKLRRGIPTDLIPRER